MHCPIARSLERVGEWWSILILRDALHGYRRFEEFRESLGVAPNILTTRLAALVEDGFLEKRQYSAHPPRYEYVPTQRGRDFRPVLLSLMAFGNRHFAPEGAMVEVVNTQDRQARRHRRVRPRDRAADRRARLRDGAGPGRERARPQALCAAQGRGRRRMNIRPEPPVAAAPVAPPPEAEPPKNMNPRTRALLQGPIVPTAAAHGVAERADHVRAGRDRADRDVLGRHARHRRARRHGAGVSRRDADADVFRRRDGRRHFVRHRARARRGQARAGRRAGAARDRRSTL